MSWEKRLRKDNGKLKKGEGRIAVIAHSEEIQNALSEGYTKKSIYEAMTQEGILSISYQTFLAHIDRHVQPSNSQQQTGVPAGKTPNEKPKSFQHNAHPSKDDYLK